MVSGEVKRLAMTVEAIVGLYAFVMAFIAGMVLQGVMR